MKKALLLFFVFFISSCSEILYQPEERYPLYPNDTYWQNSDTDWQEVDGFRIHVSRTQRGPETTLKLVAHQKGGPSLKKGYIEASLKAAYNIMTQTCGQNSPSLKPAEVPLYGQAINQFFYQSQDSSISVKFFCQTGQLSNLDLVSERQKWALAKRRWADINGKTAYIDILPPDSNSAIQMKVRLFSGTKEENKQLATRIIKKACPNVNYRILSDKEALDVVISERGENAVSEENVRIYIYACEP